MLFLLKKFGFRRSVTSRVDCLSSLLHVSIFDLSKNGVFDNKFFERLLRNFALVDWRDLIHEIGKFTLQLLGCVGLVDVLRNLSFQAPRQVEVEHSRISQVEFFVKLGRFLAQLLHITGHITNDNGIKDCAKGTQDKAREEFH